MPKFSNQNQEDNLHRYRDLFEQAILGEVNDRKRARVICEMAHIAEHLEPLMSFGDEGLRYYEIARTFDPSCIEACCGIVCAYKEMPDGHNNTELARECLAILITVDKNNPVYESENIDQVIDIAYSRGLRVNGTTDKPKG